MAFTPFVETDQPTMAEFNEKFQECIQSALDAGVQVETGYYVGSGVAGLAAGCSLTFTFPPKIVIVLGNYAAVGSNGTNGFMLWINNSNSAYMFGASNTSSNPGANGATNTAALNGNTLSWYIGWSDAAYQMNKAGVTYYYIAIGKGASE